MLKLRTLTLLVVLATLFTGSLGWAGGINVQQRVTLIPQMTGVTCWAAAASMVLGNQSVGKGKAKELGTGELQATDANIRRFAQQYGLVMRARSSYTVEGLANLLKKSPLWAAGNGHVVVIAGMEGDGTPSGTILTIFDPWPVGKGDVPRVSFKKWVADYGTVWILSK